MDRTLEELRPLPKHERIRHKVEPRRKHHVRDFLRRNATKIVAAAAIAGVAIEGYNLMKGKAEDPNAFANRTIQVSDETTLRSTPIREDISSDINNIVNWQDVEAIKTQSGDWVAKVDGKDFVIKKPAIYMKNEERPELFWYVLDAKVKGLVGESEEKIYIYGNASDSEGVKITDPGQIYMLGGDSGSDWTGTVSVQR